MNRKETKQNHTELNRNKQNRTSQLADRHIPNMTSCVTFLSLTFLVDFYDILVLRLFAIQPGNELITFGSERRKIFAAFTKRWRQKKVMLACISTWSILVSWFYYTISALFLWVDWSAVVLCAECRVYTQTLFIVYLSFVETYLCFACVCM